MKSVPKSIPKTAVGRLAKAHATQQTLTKQIEDAEAELDTALLADDDRVAKLIDCNLAELRMAAKHTARKIKLLTPLADNEQREILPPTLSAAQAKLEHLLRRQAALNGVREVDRSASQQMEIDTLVRHIGMLKQHVAQMEKMAA
jgi:hypothetical protein